MRTTYLNTVTTTFYDEDGNLWRDGYPKFIVGGNERIKIILCTKTEGAMVESANPDEWPRDASYASVDGISAMLTIDSDHIHYLKGSLSAGVSAGDTTVVATFTGDLSAVPSAGVLRLFDAQGKAEAIAYSGRSLSGNTITFALSSAVVGTYSSRDAMDVQQTPYVTAYLSADSDLSKGELVFDVVFDSLRLRSITDYANAQDVSIRGVELLFYSVDTASVIRKLRAFLWDSPSLQNSMGNPGYEADLPDDVVDKINAAVTAALNTETYQKLAEI